VSSIDLLVSRLPRHEFAIRRLYVRDPEFRAVCDDYGEVQHALEHWQAAEQAEPGRVAEYRRMLEELEAEALTFLNAFGDT
jgi:outer membrane protein assembly factor BamD (BamD/ComL family)